MSYQYKTFTYASSDGKNHIAAHLYTPTDKAVRGIVQIAHDLCDYTERYEPLARVFATRATPFAAVTFSATARRCATRPTSASSHPRTVPTRS